MMSLLRRLPYVGRLIDLLISFDARIGAMEMRINAMETRIAALDTHIARLNAQFEEHATATTQKLDSLVARVHAVEIQLEELSRNYTELTSGGLRDILEHWEQRVRDDFAIDRIHSMQEFRSEMALLRSPHEE
jgi:uncharacterized coiled-coil protein SlyX